MKEIKDFVKFRSIEEEKKKIVFYSEDSGYFSFFEGLVNELDKNDVEFCYVTSDIQDPILSDARKNINPFYINKLIAPFIKFLDSKLLIMTMPDIQQFHIKRSIKGVKHIYLFHNVGSYFHVTRYGGTFFYDTIFCVGPHHIKELRREEQLYSLPKRELVKFGYYRLDKIRRDYRKFKKDSKHHPEYKAKILMAMGWGSWKHRDSALDMCGSKMIKKLLQLNYEVILRPHPMTRIKYPDFLNSLYAKFKNYRNFKTEENVSNVNSFYEADLMISDWSGVVYEYAFGTEKPVLFIDTPMKINNPDYKKYGFDPIDKDIRHTIGYVLNPDDIDDIGDIITRIINKQAKYKEAIRILRKKLVFNLGNSSKKGAEFIISCIQDRLMLRDRLPMPDHKDYGRLKILEAGKNENNKRIHKRGAI